MADNEVTRALDLVEWFDYTLGGAWSILTWLKKQQLVINDRRGEWVLTDRGYARLEHWGFIQDEDEVYLGIDEHSFRHQELVHTVTEVKQRKVLGILRDDRMATLKKFLSKIPRDKVREVCIDMKDGLRKAVEAVFPLDRVVVDPFHVTADSNKRMDEARRIEQDVHRKKKVQTPKKIFLVGREKLTEERRQRVDALLGKYPGALAKP